MNDYISQWNALCEDLEYNLPKVFHKNFFKEDKNNHIMWPGFGENSRVLKWIWERVEESRQILRTPLEFMPPAGALDTKGPEMSAQTLQKLFRVNQKEWQAEANRIRSFYRGLKKLPKSVDSELDVRRNCRKQACSSHLGIDCDAGVLVLIHCPKRTRNGS